MGVRSSDLFLKERFRYTKPLNVHWGMTLEQSAVYLHGLGMPFPPPGAGPYAHGMHRHGMMAAGGEGPSSPIHEER